MNIDEPDPEIGVYRFPSVETTEIKELSRTLIGYSNDESWTSGFFDGGDVDLTLSIDLGTYDIWFIGKTQFQYKPKIKVSVCVEHKYSVVYQEIVTVSHSRIRWDGGAWVFEHVTESITPGTPYTEEEIVSDWCDVEIDESSLDDITVTPKNVFP